jgi:DNA modification methylase
MGDMDESDLRVTWQILDGDALETLRKMPAGIAQTCVTSPPYWGLRDYGTSVWAGGDGDCDHRKKNPVVDQRTSTLGSNSSGLAIDNSAYQLGKHFLHTCPKCGARRVGAEIGLEPSPEEYVSRLVEVFREVWRVLRDDGTLWLNLGDSYNGSGGVGGPGKSHTNQGSVDRRDNRAGWSGLKQKDLVGIPWRVAFALQADGWYLRSDIIWSKPNPMPESVRDRPTKAHEYIFLLAKAKSYYYDAKSIEEMAICDRMRGTHDYSHVPGGGDNSGLSHGQFTSRNRRSVWTIPAQSFSGAHFAVFPPALIDPCILAGAPEGGLVLDPFAGSGTVGVVCRKHKRRFVGIELNPDYARMARGRLGEDVVEGTETSNMSLFDWAR